MHTFMIWVLTSGDLPKDPHNIDGCIDTLVHYLNSACKELPRSKFKKNVRPFWNEHLNDLKAIKVKCHRIWKEAGRPRGDNQLYINHKQARKNFMYELRKVQKDYERKEIDEIIFAAHSSKDKFKKRLRKLDNPAKTMSLPYAILLVK